MSKVDQTELKTSAEWQELYPYPKVMDPDGWDRKNYDYSWYQEKINIKEYASRVRHSTCMHKVGADSILNTLI